jgi:hypothetical protein
MEAADMVSYPRRLECNVNPTARFEILTTNLLLVHLECWYHWMIVMWIFWRLNFVCSFTDKKRTCWYFTLSIFYGINTLRIDTLWYRCVTLLIMVHCLCYTCVDTLQCMQLMGAENQSDATGGISTQVLDLVLGVPVSRMAVKLWLECGNTWTQISEGWGYSQ